MIELRLGKSETRDYTHGMEKMTSSNDAVQGGNGAGGIYSVERLLAAVLLTTSGPGALSQWLALVWNFFRMASKQTSLIDKLLTTMVSGSRSLFSCRTPRIRLANPLAAYSRRSSCTWHAWASSAKACSCHLCCPPCNSASTGSPSRESSNKQLFGDYLIL
jgi:hypothetical protein